MMKQPQARPARRAALFGLASLAAVVIIVAIARDARPRRSRERLLSQYEQSYLRVEENMTQERVIELMGKPSEVLPAGQVQGAAFWDGEPLPRDEAARIRLCLRYWARPRSEPYYVFSFDEQGALVGKRRVR